MYPDRAFWSAAKRPCRRVRVSSETKWLRSLVRFAGGNPKLYSAELVANGARMFVKGPGAAAEYWTAAWASAFQRDLHAGYYATRAEQPQTRP